MAVSRIPDSICVRLSKETLKCIDYNFAHQSANNAWGVNRAKVSLKKLPVRQVVRLLSV